MARERIGELLGRMVRLTPHDVEEILQEQSATRRRFGEIALNWGLCQPQHVWNAWMSQLTKQSQRIDLDQMGVDCQALSFLQRELAVHLCAIPVRAWGDEVVIAVADPDSQSVLAALPEALRGHVQFVVADADAIRRAIGKSYCALELSA